MKRQGQFAGIGIPSIITILLVLVLAVFSSLTVISAKAELSLAEKTAQSESSYYRADAESERELAALAKRAQALDNYRFETQIDEKTALVTTVSMDENGHITALAKTLRSLNEPEYDMSLNLME